MFGPTVTAAEVRDALATEWPRDGRIFILGAGCLRDADDAVFVHRGLSLIIRPFGATSPDYMSYDDRVLSLLANDGFGKDEFLPYHGMLQDTLACLRQDGDDLIFHCERGDQEGIKRCLMMLTGCGEPTFGLVTSSRYLWNYCCRGLQVEDILGMQLQELEGRTGIFLEARDLGYDVQFLCVPGSEMFLTDLLNLAGVGRPNGRALRVQGAISFSPFTETLVFGQRSVTSIVVDVRQRPFPVITSGLQATHEGGQDHPDDDDSESRSGDNIVTANEGHHSGTSSSSTEPPANGGGARCPTEHMWKLASRPDAFPECQPMDTPMEQADKASYYEGGALRAISKNMAWTLFPPNDLLAFTDSGRQHLGHVIDFLETKISPGSKRVDTCQSRPIPTPCRRSTKLPVLEQSPAVEEETPAVISIADCIGPREHDLAQHFLQVIDRHDMDAIWTLVLPWRSSTLGPGPQWDQLKDCTKQALAICSDNPAGRCPPVLEIYTDGSAKDGDAGYAVVFVGQWPDEYSTVYMGCLGGPVTTNSDDHLFVRAEATDAYNAEITALIWGMLWCASHWQQFCRPWLKFRYDAMVAGNFCSGKWEQGWGAIGCFAREIARFLEQCVGVYSIAWEHVRGHSEHPWNEMADRVADAAMRGCRDGIPQPDPGWHFQIGQVRLEWALLVPMSCSSDVIPLNHLGQLQWKEEEEPPAALCVEQVIPVTERISGKQMDLSLRVVSANVQTCVGKYKFLEAQLKQRQVQIFCVQESRSHEGLVRSQDFFRFASDGKSHWGAEIWVARGIHFAMLDGKPVFVDDSCVSVTSTSPRHVHLVIDIAGHKLHVASIHFPQRNRPEAEKAQCAQVLMNICLAAKGHSCVIGIDANGRVPLCFQNATGDLYADEEDENGRLVAQTVATHEMWFPSTFDTCQVGPGATWTHSTGSRSRIDYIIVSNDVPQHAVCTTVLCDLELMTRNDDHDAVQADISFSFVKWGVAPARLRRTQGLDVRKLDEPARLAIFEDCLDRSGVGSISWEVDVNTHALWVQQAINRALWQALPKRQDTPKSNYVPETAWHLRHAKGNFKKNTRNRKAGYKFEAVRLAFDIWRTSAKDPWYVFRRKLLKHVLLYEVAAAAVQIVTSTMRRLIQDQKNKLLTDLATRFGRTRPDELMQMLKAMHLGRRKQAPWRRPMPCVAQNGKAAMGRQDLDALWLDHFGRMEFGQIVDAQTFFCHPQQYGDADSCFVPELAAFPGMHEIERAFRSTRSHRSPGLDLVYGEVLKKSPGRIAAITLPLMMKSAARRVQPVQWRGGVLAECFKGKGAVSDPGAYRSLYVSSMLGKAYHKVLRSKATPAAEKAFSAGHFAARKGAPVTMASLMVILFERWKTSANYSNAILFLDIQSAYYSVVRQLAYGDYAAADADSQFCAVLKHFQLPPSVWHELQQAASNGGLMGLEGTGGHLRSLIKDSHDGSYFVTRYASGERLCKTEAGSRPGESLADLVYAWIFHAVLRDVTERLRAEGILEEVPYSGEMSPFPSPVVEHVPLLGPTWADDSTFVCSDRDTEVLVSKARRMASTVVDCCTKRGLIPNFKPGKTSFILNLRGKGSKRTQTELFGNGDRHLEIVTADRGKVDIPVVQTYIHLGCAVEKSMTLQTEAHRRTAVASSAFEPLRRLVFQNTAVPVEVRGRLLTVFIDSTYFNLEVWNGHLDKGWKRLQLGHQHILRRMLAKDLTAEEIYKLTPAECSCYSAHPPLHIIHITKRLRFMISMVRAAPPVLWALVQAEGQWGQQLLQDLRWFVKFAGGIWPDVTEVQWPVWWHRMRDAPNAFRRAVNRAADRAMLAFISDELCLAHTDSVHREIARSYPAAVAVMPATSWVCPPCKMVFQSKANLSCHFFKKHQRVAAQRLFTGGTICPRCLIDYFDDYRMQMHLKKNPKCLQFVKERGFCGREAKPGIGSKVWRETRQKLPIVCPPVAQEVVEMPTASNCGHTGNPAQADIDSLAGAIGAILDVHVPRHGPDDVLHAVKDETLRFPLLPTEIGLAVQQASDDIALCYRDGALNWTGDAVEAVVQQLQCLRELVQSSWLINAVITDGPHLKEEVQLGESHVPRIRRDISAQHVPPRNITVVLQSDTDAKRTRATCLLLCLGLPIRFTRSSGDCTRMDALFISCFTEGEAAASVAGCDRNASAALGKSCPVVSLTQCRHLRTVLKAWREVWTLLLRGFSAGILCNGPSAWIGFLRGHALSGVCEWATFSSADAWGVQAIPAGASGSAL